MSPPQPKVAVVVEVEVVMVIEIYDMH